MTKAKYIQYKKYQINLFIDEVYIVLNVIEKYDEIK